MKALISDQLSNFIITEHILHVVIGENIWLIPESIDYVILFPQKLQILTSLLIQKLQILTSLLIQKHSTNMHLTLFLHVAETREYCSARCPRDTYYYTSSFRCSSILLYCGHVNKFASIISNLLVYVGTWIKQEIKIFRLLMTVIFIHLELRMSSAFMN